MCPRIVAHTLSDAMTKGITIVAALDAHEDAQWHAGRIIPLFFDLADTGRFSLEGLNTNVFAPQDCAAAYGLANASRGATLGIVFDWSKQSGSVA